MYTDAVGWPLIVFIKEQNQTGLKKQHVAVGKICGSTEAIPQDAKKKWAGKKMSQWRPSQAGFMGSALKPDWGKEWTFVIDFEASGVNGLIRVQMEPHLMGHADDQVGH